jgi:hypothetical protein
MDITSLQENLAFMLLGESQAYYRKMGRVEEGKFLERRIPESFAHGNLLCIMLDGHGRVRIKDFGLALTIFAVIVLYAFRTSLSSRPLFSAAQLDDRLNHNRIFDIFLFCLCP